MKKTSIQLYSARNFMPLGKVFSDLAAIGYTDVEGYGDLFQSTEDLNDALSTSGLSMPTSHFDPAWLEFEPEKCLSISNSIGIKSIYYPHLLPDDRPTDVNGWKAFGARLQNIAKPFKDAELTFGWHNHDFEFKPLKGGQLPIDLIFEGGPEIEWEIDVAWVVRAGLDPIVYINKYSDRITAAHIKDLAPAGQLKDEDGWADVGHGIIEWAPIIEALDNSNSRRLVVEHDNPSDFNRFARRSIATTNTF